MFSALLRLRRGHHQEGQSPNVVQEAGEVGLLRLSVGNRPGKPFAERRREETVLPKRLNVLRCHPMPHILDQRASQDHRPEPFCSHQHHRVLDLRHSLAKTHEGGVAQPQNLRRQAGVGPNNFPTRLRFTGAAASRLLSSNT